MSGVPIKGKKSEFWTHLIPILHSPIIIARLHCDAVCGLFLYCKPIVLRERYAGKKSIGM